MDELFVGDVLELKCQMAKVAVEIIGEGLLLGQGGDHSILMTDAMNVETEDIMQGIAVGTEGVEGVIGPAVVQEAVHVTAEVGQGATRDLAVVPDPVDLDLHLKRAEAVLALKKTGARDPDLTLVADLLPKRMEMIGSRWVIKDS